MSTSVLSAKTGTEMPAFSAAPIRTPRLALFMWLCSLGWGQGLGDCGAFVCIVTTGVNISGARNALFFNANLERFQSGRGKFWQISRLGKAAAGRKMHQSAAARGGG